jgi:hypothetical protein
MQGAGLAPGPFVFWGVVMKRAGFAAALALLACGSSLAVPASARLQSAAQAQGDKQPPETPQEERQRREPQPGATQGGVLTTETDAQSKFNMDYFVGEWTFESSLADSPLGTGGPISGTEIVRNVWDGRFWDITIKGEGPDGPFTGKGIITYQDTFAGQFYTRYEVTRGIALLRTGNLGCDLGGTCNLHFETPPFEHNGARIQLRGRYYLTSPFAYRVTTEISVDKGEYRNFGTVRYTKDEKARPPAIR